ncbi:MAG: DUF952 domain-containing protein [Armatimonadaceae bacterium]
MFLLHITSRTEWEDAEPTGLYAPPSLETEGFIHLSQPEQVVWVANRFYREQSGLVLLKIEPERLKAPLRYDPVPGDGVFPHLYGPLNTDAVVQVLPFEPETDGSFSLPSLD